MTETSTDTTSPKKKGFLKIAGIGCGGLLVIFIILAVIFAPSKEERDAAQRYADSIEALIPEPAIKDSAATPPIAEPAQKGIGKSRQELITLFEKQSLEFSFTKGVDVNGADNYVGTSELHGRSTVQLIGPRDELSQASVSAVLGGNSDENLAPLIMITGFATQFDQDAGGWIKEVFDRRTFTSDFEESHDVQDVTLELHYTKFDGAAVMVITAKPR